MRVFCSAQLQSHVGVRRRALPLPMLMCASVLVVATPLRYTTGIWWIFERMIGERVRQIWMRVEMHSSHVECL